MNKYSLSLPKIGIIGYGSMGKEIENVAKSKSLIVTDIIDIDNPLSIEKKYEFDVAIDFSIPSSLMQNVKILSKLKKNIVIGTTGWYESLNEVKEIVLKEEVGAVYGSNYSIGMQIFQRLVSLASISINSFDDYDIFMNEIHHKRKKDSPSGTALTLANIILHNIDRKKQILDSKSESEISPADLHLSSIRGGEIAGTHTVFLDSFSDTIELTHRAKNRTGFALGALNSAIWIYNKKGFYKFDEIFPDLIA